MKTIFALVRTITYASLFSAILLVFVPARILGLSGISMPATWDAARVGGSLLVVLGAACSVSCLLAFALVGKGTPAPFDPPRRLVIRGPYKYVRNPMYLGAGMALVGAALFCNSIGLISYSLVFFACAHGFVVLYEEPTLRRMFGTEYAEYVRHVPRWLPGNPRRVKDPEFSENGKDQTTERPHGDARQHRN